jgi:hypothetical protein
MNNIENYILNLDFMQDSVNNTWNHMFDQTFEDWNACHRLIPNLFLRNNIAIENSKQLLISSVNVPDNVWKQVRGPDWPDTWAEFDNRELTTEIQQEIETLLGLTKQQVQVTTEEYNFLSNNLLSYKNTVTQIEKFTHDGLLVSGVPLKLQSLQERLLKKVLKRK